MREVFANALDVVSIPTLFRLPLNGPHVEQIFWILFGLGSNGKSTLIEIINEVFGPYAWTMPFPTAT